MNPGYHIYIYGYIVIQRTLNQNVFSFQLNKFTYRFSFTSIYIHIN